MAPVRHNALSLDDIAVLRQHLVELGRHKVRVVTLRASGRSFCSGHDLGHFDPGRPVAPPVEFEALAAELEALTTPTICVLQGGVYGGGIDIALACDFRVGVPAVRMSMPATAIGIHLYPGALGRFVSRLGLGAAKRVVLLGDTLDARALAHLGVLDRLVADQDLDAAVAELEGKLSGGAPLALQGMKASLNAYAAARADEAVVASRFRDSFATADLREGLNAMREKRRPVFDGC